MDGNTNGINPLEALAALEVGDIRTTQPIAGGMDTLIWRVNTLDGAYALRLFRPDQRDQCAKEVRLMEMVRARGMPVPQVIAHGAWNERPVLLMEWVAGRTVLDVVLERPDLCGPLGRSMGRLQARLHAISAPKEDWEDHHTWLSWCGPHEEELRSRLRMCGLRDGHILHLDFHPRNVLCTGQEATAVLDWANAEVGDPRADVARTLSIFRFVSPPPGVGSTFATARARLERAWMDGYTEVTEPLPDMELFELWAAIVFIRDMEQHRGKPGFSMSPQDFDRVRVAIGRLRERTGLSPAHRSAGDRVEDR
jgi:aminoglycoside phosphotransferase (APT) family kinase protein